MSHEKYKNSKWYIGLMKRFKQVAERLGLPEDASGELRTFLVDIAREQYMAGNRSGIAWARKQAEASA